MVISKKKSKNIAKQQKRTSAKAKQKAKKAQQIEAGKKIKESRRSAAKLTGKDKEDAIAGIDSVDELFQSDIFADDDDDVADETMPGGEGEDDDEESSAGAFHDVGGADDDDEGLPPDLAALGDGAAHEKELLAIKKSDPTFYNFLVENDRQLLDFRAPEEEDKDGEEDDADEAEVQGGKGKKASKTAEKASSEGGARVVTLERMRVIQENAKTSFTAFKAALTAYHAAIRSIEGGVGKGAAGQNDDEDEEDLTGASRGRRRRRKTQQSLMQITDEAVFSAIIEWTISNIVELLEVHGGELQGSAKGGQAAAGAKSGKKRRTEDPEAEEGSFVDPTKYSRWPRIKVMASIFWDETYYLLTHLVAPEMLEFVLRNISSRQALVWMWPFRGVRRKFCNKCCILWSGSGTQPVRLLSFLFIRNAAAMSTVAPKDNSPLKKDQTELETMVRAVLRAFADAASGGYSWRSVSTFRFMENCYLELLRLDDATAYRVGYVCVRQLALILRNACIATSQGGGSSKASANEDKKRKRKSLHQQQVQNLIGWPFVRSLHLWTKAIGALPCLRPLAYPLATITTGALKSKLTSIQYFPFVYQCIRCLNKLSASLEVFVPVSSHLLKAFSVLLPAMEKAHRDRKGVGGGKPEKGEALAKAKAPDIDILLRFTDGQAAEVMTMEAVGGFLCYLLTDHLGVLARSPSFPEVVAPVLFHLKKDLKHCRSENLRRQLKQLVTHAESSAGDITSRRELLPEKEVTAWKKFFLFDADTTMAKARNEALIRKEREERQRVEAETRPDEKKKPKADPEAEPETKEKKAKKREKQKERLKRKEQKEAASVGAAPTQKKADGGIPGKAKEDVVEEMGFSSGDSDED